MIILSYMIFIVLVKDCFALFEYWFLVI